MSLHEHGDMAHRHNAWLPKVSESGSRVLLATHQLRLTDGNRVGEKCMDVVIGSRKCLKCRFARVVYRTVALAQSTLELRQAQSIGSRPTVIGAC